MGDSGDFQSSTWGKDRIVWRKKKNRTLLKNLGKSFGNGWKLMRYRIGKAFTKLGKKNDKVNTFRYLRQDYYINLLNRILDNPGLKADIISHKTYQRYISWSFIKIQLKMKKQKLEEAEYFALGTFPNRHIKLHNGRKHYAIYWPTVELNRHLSVEVF